MTTIDPRRCPACGQPNDCARADSPATACTDCWCHHVQVASTVLANLPAEARGRACVCATCARGDLAPKPVGCTQRA